MDTVEVESRERIEIRMRESQRTISGWRVRLRSPNGAIVLAEISGKVWYRGEGALLGSSQEKLAELWQKVKSTDSNDLDLPQYG